MPYSISPAFSTLSDISFGSSTSSSRCSGASCLRAARRLAVGADRCETPVEGFPHESSPLDALRDISATLRPDSASPVPRDQPAQSVLTVLRLADEVPGRHPWVRGPVADDHDSVGPAKKSIGTSLRRAFCDRGVQPSGPSLLATLRSTPSRMRSPLPIRCPRPCISRLRRNPGGREYRWVDPPLRVGGGADRPPS